MYILQNHKNCVVLQYSSIHTLHLKLPAVNNEHLFIYSPEKTVCPEKISETIKTAKQCI